MDWLAEDGLMRLDPNDMREPFPGADFPTVKNQNGILFRAVNELLSHRAGKTKAANDFIETCKRLEHPQKPGFFLRHPMNIESDEAQDNYAGIIAGCMLYGDYSIPRRIYMAGSSEGFHYDARDGSDWSPRYQRQGGEIAFYQLGAGLKPTIWYWFWFLAGILVNAFQPRNGKYNDSSDAQLAWVRLEGIWHRIRSGKNIQYWVRPSYDIVRWIWTWRTVSKYGSEAGFAHIYYQYNNHPNRILANEVV